MGNDGEIVLGVFSSFLVFLRFLFFFVYFSRVSAKIFFFSAVE